MGEQHTPGPWAARFEEATRIRDGGGATVCTVSQLSRSTRREWKEVAANARLIAAAPSMLNALKDIAGWRDLDMLTAKEKLDAVEEIARAAIAKAEPPR